MRCLEAICGAFSSLPMSECVWIEAYLPIGDLLRGKVFFIPLWFLIHWINQDAHFFAFDNVAIAFSEQCFFVSEVDGVT